MSQRVLLPRKNDAPENNVPSSQKEDEKRDPSPTSSTTSRKRGPLIAAACNACRKRKVKCDGNKPTCSNCHRRTIPCTYDETSKSERLRLVQDRLKEAHDEIGNLRRHIESLTQDMQDPRRRESLAQAGGDLDRLADKVTQIGSEIPAKPSDTQTQHPMSDGQDLDPIEATHSVTAQSDKLPPQSRIMLSGHISVMVPTSNMPTATSDPVVRFGAHALAPALAADGYLRIYEQQTQTNLYTSLHHLVPLNYVVHDDISKPCILQQLRCRECLAEGISLEDVLGSDTLDLTCLIAPDNLTAIHPFTSWVVSYVDAFSGCVGLDWIFRIATIYCMFHTLRWLVFPSAEHYARVPDFMKPTPMQLFVPHSFWINFVLLPTTRNEYILHPHADQLRHWTRIFLSARINWPHSDMSSAVALNPITNAFNLRADFEATIRSVENWYLPY